MALLCHGAAVMNILILQPPSPPGINVKRDLAGGMGVADPSKRRRFGHDRQYITMPYISLVYTAGVLDRDGHQVTFVDGQAENLDLDQVVDRVKQVLPEVVIQVFNLPSLYGDLQVAKAIRERVAGVKLVAVGTVAIPLLDFIAESGAVDAIIRGDAELVTPSLLQVFQGMEESSSLWERRHGVLVNRRTAHLESLEDLPPLPYHLIPLEKYWYYPFGRGVPYASVFSSKGCCYRCYYCPYPMGFGDQIVHRDPVAVVNEIEDLYRTRGIRAFLFRDQVFTADREKVIRLCDEILRRELKIRWLVETRLDTVDEDLLRKMKEAGCIRIQVGIESGDPELFDKVGKQGAKGMLPLFEKNFELIERVGIAPHMFMLVGLLGETWQSVRRTVEMVRRIKPLTLQVSVVTPYPGTGLYEAAKRKGLLCTEDFSQFTGFHPVSRTEQMSPEDLENARQMILREHRRATFWKRQRRLAELTVRYARDGSLWSRLRRRSAIWMDDAFSLQP